MDYKEKASYAEPDGITYVNPKTGEKILVQTDQYILEGSVKKGSRKTRRSKRKSKKRLPLKLRKVR